MNIDHCFFEKSNELSKSLGQRFRAKKVGKFLAEMGVKKERLP
jgi:hypothetical protein